MAPDEPDSRPARLARRDHLVRELATRFYADIPACARPAAISRELDREACLRTPPSSPKRVLLRQVLQTNGGAGLSRIQLRSLLMLWTRTPPRRFSVATDNGPPNPRPHDDPSGTIGRENAEARQVVRRRSR